MTTSSRSNALVFKVTHPNVANRAPPEQRVEMLSKQSKLHSDLEEKAAQLAATKVSAERTQHNMSRLQGEVKRLRTESHAREKELVFYRNASEESESKLAEMGQRLRKVETELLRARAENRTISTRPGAVTAARHERAQERLSAAAEHTQRLTAQIQEKDALVVNLEKEVKMLKREANLLAQALDAQESVASGAVGGAAIFVESAKLKEQVKAMALGAADKSAEVARLRRELDDTRVAMKAQHGAELEAKALESRAMEKELAQLRLERTAMLEHTANMAQRHTRKVTEGGDDRRRVLELQRKVETQGETIQSLLEMKNRLLEQMQGRQNIGGREDTTPPDLMGSLDPRHGGASVPGTQQRDAAAAADSFRTANSSGGGDSESLRHELQEERARADREARSVRLLRQELAGLHGDIGDLRQQLLEAQNANLQYERAAWSAVGQDQSTGVAAQQQVSILQQENNELLERLQEMSGHIQQLSAQNTLLAQKSSGGRPPVATQTAGATPRDEANPQTTSAR